MGIHIGSIETRNRVFLAPMSGVTDEPTRRSGWRTALVVVAVIVAGVGRQVSVAPVAVDGAAVMTDSYELLAFGAKIARRRGSTQKISGSSRASDIGKIPLR